MKTPATYARFVWGTLAYNIFVIVWGAFVRATGSGAGCGSHWPLCNGDVLPRSPALETLIEFTHRVTSGFALIAVILMVFWARRLFQPGHPARRAAWLSLILILVEALLGAGLVLLEYTEQDASPGRAAYLSAHLVNTLLLLAAIAATAWIAGRAGRTVALGKISRRYWFAVAAALLASVSGAIAALGDTLYPASTFAEGVIDEFAAGAPALLRLRLAHPLIALLSGCFLAWLGLVNFRTEPHTQLRRDAFWVLAITLAQFAAGLINIALLAPVWMQLVHLFLATFLWVALCLMIFERSSPYNSNELA